MGPPCVVLTISLGTIDAHLQQLSHFRPKLIRRLVEPTAMRFRLAHGQRRLCSSLVFVIQLLAPVDAAHEVSVHPSQEALICCHFSTVGCYCVIETPWLPLGYLQRCSRPQINEAKLQDHACTLFDGVCIDQVNYQRPDADSLCMLSPAKFNCICH